MRPLATPRKPSRAGRVGWLERLLGSFTSSPSDRALRETATPARLGRYRILHPLGQGGMGTVYAAEDLLEAGTVPDIRIIDRRGFWQLVRQRRS